MATVRERRSAPVRLPPQVNTGNASANSTTQESRADEYQGVTTDADQRLRAGALAGGGATQTKVPDLLADWQTATLEATADELAREEMRPDLERALSSAEKSKGDALTDDEILVVSDAFFTQHAARLDQLTRTHLADLNRQRDRSLQQVVIDRRPLIAKKRDPFTPLAQNDPAARAKERVLWENSRLMVLVDLFSPRPKALVVPKAPMMFPVEAPPDLLQELARVAAHVSDAFMATTGCPAAGIWINPPQHLMVKQLHVHVLPELPPFSPGEPLIRAAARDPAIAAKADQLFQDLEKALSAKL